jgi:DNA polymerase-3 subunit delta
MSPAFVACFCGDDEYAVKQRARAHFRSWSEELGGQDHEIVDATAANSGEAMRALGRLREALQTLPFLGRGKVVWLKDCNFLGEERAASTAAVTEALSDLAGELKHCLSPTVRLVISTGKMDKRRTFYKTLDKWGAIQVFPGLSAEDRDWPLAAAALAEKHLAELGKSIAADALNQLVAAVGPNARQLRSEAEKVALYAGEAAVIEAAAVAAVVTRNRHARAFALGDALGDRHIPRLLRALDDELWESRVSSQKSEIGVLYGLISKVRTLLLVRALMDAGHLRAETDYSRFRGQLERLPPELLPSDRRLNPMASNPYILFKATQQAKAYTRDELARAMQVLLDCNRRLVSTGTNEALALQRAVLQIALGRQPQTASR